MAVVTVPADVAAQTLRIATELPVSGDIRSGVWETRRFMRDGSPEYWIRFFGPRFWVVNPFIKYSGPRVRTFATWDEVRVALDEAEERGSWWP